MEHVDAGIAILEIVAFGGRMRYGVILQIDTMRPLHYGLIRLLVKSLCIQQFALIFYWRRLISDIVGNLGDV